MPDVRPQQRIRIHNRSAQQSEADIASGKLHPFTGPMKDNEGKERLAASKVIGDDALSKMDYYVDGVQGRLPANK